MGHAPLRALQPSRRKASALLLSSAHASEPAPTIAYVPTNASEASGEFIKKGHKKLYTTIKGVEVLFSSSTPTKAVS